MSCQPEPETNNEDVMIPEGFRRLFSGEAVPEIAYVAESITNEGKIIWRRSMSVGKFAKDCVLFHICPIANIYVEKAHVNKKTQNNSEACDGKTA